MRPRPAGVSSTPLGRQLPRGWRSIANRLADDGMSGHAWSDLEMWGFVTLHVTPNEIVGRWYAVDAREPDAHAELRVTWAVDTDAPGEVRLVGVLHDVAVERAARWSVRRWVTTAAAVVVAAGLGAVALRRSRLHERVGRSDRRR